MADGFDAYHKWLGIPPSEQPPHHYRLLGVPLFEQDRDVVQNAADRQMAHVRSYQTGPHSVLSQKLLNEIASAKVVLLNPQRRGAYDFELQRKLAPPAPPRPAAPAPQIAEPATIPLAPGALGPSQSDFAFASDIGSKRERPSEAALPPGVVAALVGGAFVVLLGLCFVVYHFVASPEKQPVAISDPLARPDPASVHPKPQAEPQPPLVGQRPVQPQPRPIGTKPFGAVPFDQPGTPLEFPDPDATRPAIPNQASLKEQPARPNATVDALALIDPSRDTLEGQWTREGPRLHSSIKRSRVRVPVTLDGPDYKLEIRLQCENPRPSAMFVVGLPVGDQHCMVGFDVEGHAGIGRILGRPWNNNSSTARGKTAVAIGSHTIECLVRPHRIIVTLDRNPVLKWQGEPFQLGPQPEWNADLTSSFMIGSDQSIFIIHSLRVSPIPAEVGTSIADDPATRPGMPQTPAQPDAQPDTAPLTTKPLAGERIPPPKPEELGAIRERALLAVKDDLAGAKLPAQHAAVAQRLLDQGRATEDNAMKYVLLNLAADEASEGGQINQAFEAMDALSVRFDIDPLQRKDELLAHAARQAKGDADFRGVSESWVMLLQDAIAADRYDLAGRYADNAIAASRKSSDKVVQALLVNGGKEVDQLKAAYELVKADREKLAQSPDDSVATARWGRFLCAYKNNWVEGLPLWAKGDDELAPVAAADFATPQDPADQVKVADEWWDAAQTQKDLLPKKFISARAAQWYRVARSALAEPKLTEVNKRLESFEAGGSTFPLRKWVDAEGGVDPRRHALEGQWVRRGSQLFAMQRGTSWIALPVAPSGSYDFTFRFMFGDPGEVDVQLPVGARGVTLIVAGYGGKVSGLSMIDKRPFDKNVSTVKASKFIKTRWYTLTSHVETKGDTATVEVELDSRPYLRWSGPASSLSPSFGNGRLPPGALAIGCTGNSTIALQNVRLRMLSGTATVLN